LRFLKKQGIANYRKDGKLVYYSLANERVRDRIKLILLNFEGVGV
ncbi:Cd(II)-sensing metalloregulatory transcriptional repressor CadC, partial [Listeria monocytogenes]